MISHCGLICTECDAYQATRTMDQQKATAVAAQWSQQFGVEVKVEHVWCDGCLVGGKKCAHCGECELRACSMGKGLKNCGRCDEYPCAKLEGFFQMAPQARAVLDGEHAAR